MQINRIKNFLEQMQMKSKMEKIFGNKTNNLYHSKFINETKKPNF